MKAYYVDGGGRYFVAFAANKVEAKREGVEEFGRDNLVFTHYRMTAYAEDGSKLQIGYDVKQDARFNKDQKPEG